MYKTINKIGIIAVVFLFVIGLSSAWANNSFTRMKPINISSTTATTDYQVFLNITYDSDMRPDFGDLRFYANDNTTMLSYWVENKTDSTRALVWVKVPSLISGNTTIYMYYGNPTVNSSSSLNNTFLMIIPNLIGAWTFDDNAGSIARDTSGYGNNGTIIGATWTSLSKYKSALSFDGNDYVDFGNQSYFKVSTGTIEGWMRPTSTAVMFAFGIPYSTSADWNAPYVSLQFGSYNSLGKWWVNINGTNREFNAGSISNSVWYHMTHVFNGTHRLAYLNGSNIYSNSDFSGTIHYSGNPNLMAGVRKKQSLSEYFIGQIDELRIYNRSLTSTEISALHSNYGYTTPNSIGNVLVKKYLAIEPTATFGNEEILFNVYHTATYNTSVYETTNQTFNTTITNHQNNGVNITNITNAWLNYSGVLYNYTSKSGLSTVWNITIPLITNVSETKSITFIYDTLLSNGSAYRLVRNETNQTVHRNYWFGSFFGNTTIYNATQYSFNHTALINTSLGNAQTSMLVNFNGTNTSMNKVNETFYNHTLNFSIGGYYPFIIYYNVSFNGNSRIVNGSYNVMNHYLPWYSDYLNLESKYLSDADCYDYYRINGISHYILK